MRPSWTRSRSQIQSFQSVTITALPKSSSAGIVFWHQEPAPPNPEISRARVHGADRGSDQALQKKCRMPTVMSQKKWTSQSDKMMRCTFFYTRPALHSWKAVFPMWRTTAQHLGRGCEWPLWSSQTWKWHIVCTAQSCSRFFFSKVADAAREHQTHHQPTEKWKVVCGPGRFSELGCVDLGVVRTRACVTRADVSANGTQAGRGSVFSSRTLARNSLQSPISKVLGRTQIEGNLQEMILVVHFLTFKQETHKWHHVCASRVCSLFCEIKDRLRGKQIHFEFIVIQSRDDVDVVSNGTKSRSCCNGGHQRSP